MRTTPWIAATALAATLIAAPAHAQDEAPESIPIDSDTRTLAPGLELESFDRWEEQGWLRADAATVDLTADVTARYLSPGAVGEAAPLRDQVAGVDDTVLAFNADFFDINDTGGPEGAAVDGGELVKSADAGEANVIAFDADGRGSIQTIGFSGTAETDDGELDLHGLNNTAIPTDAVGLYTPDWGEAARSRVAEGAEGLIEVTIADGLVTDVTDEPESGAVPDGAVALVGREAGADALGALDVGDAVTIEYAPVTDGPMPETAASGREILVQDGEVVEHDDEDRHPRTAVGFSEDGTEMYTVTFDGRQDFSDGYTLEEVARELRAMGAHSAVNLDGGGSSTMLARDPGTDDLVTVNSPSDDEERPVGNGIALTVPAGDGAPSGFAVEPAAPFDPGAIDPEAYDHVFPGLSRSLDAAAHDQTYAPAEATPSWSVDPILNGHVDADGVFHAGALSGPVTATARSGAASGETALTVLGPLSELRPSKRLVTLADADASGELTLIGADDEGFTAPIDPADVALDYDEDLVAIEPDGQGGFALTAATDSGSGTVEMAVGDHTTSFAVTIGLTETGVSDFADADEWAFSAARATGSAEPGEGYDGDGLTISYDFTQDTATRAAYVTPPADLPVDGQSQRFDMWIDSQGNGEWPSLQLTDATGNDVVLRADLLEEEGWQQVEFEVPEDTAQPVTVNQFYLAETRPDALYEGEVTISDLNASVAPEVDVPVAEDRPDPLVAPDLEGADWNFAVMSDAQFVAEEPDSPIVESARRTLGEIRESDADFLVINGDLVDECGSDDLALAEQILDEELGDELDWVYVPGNHEVMGCDIDDWSEVFGPAYQSFDHGGTRFVTLDTSSLTIAGGGFEQISMLRDALDEAAEDPQVHSVAVVAHVPPNDEATQGASELDDRLEAAVVEDWLGDFEADSGKEAVYIGGHTGYFAGDHNDGVAYWINGNSGKAPSTDPADGGFVGWTQLGVTEDGGNQPWLAAQVRPQVDELSLDAPDVATGEAVEVEAELTQGEATMPVAYPMSAAWSGSDNLYVGEDPPGPIEWLIYDAWFDPSGNELAAWRSGTVELQVSVNDEEASRTITVD